MLPYFKYLNASYLPAHNTVQDCGRGALVDIQLWCLRPKDMVKSKFQVFAVLGRKNSFLFIAKGISLRRVKHNRLFPKCLDNLAQIRTWNIWFKSLEATFTFLKQERFWGKRHTIKVLSNWTSVIPRIIYNSLCSLLFSGLILTHIWIFWAMNWYCLVKNVLKQSLDYKKNAEKYSNG